MENTSINFHWKRWKKRGFKETAFVYNFILTRIETILKQLDDNIEVERKVIGLFIFKKVG